MKKAIISMILVLVLLFMSCSSDKVANDTASKKKSVTLSVSTMYAGNDSNTKNFKEAVKEWESITGYTVEDVSSTADEAYKSRVIMDFQTGAEPDIQYYFNGVDANPLVANKRVVSVDEIRKEFPEYANNMKDNMMHASPYDGKVYCIPVNGYWEALYVNKAICEKVGISVPDASTTWEEFVIMCERVRDEGYIPIAASLAEVPHYWFEYCIYNHQTPKTHSEVPDSMDSEGAKAWIDGITDIKNMYTNGYFPANTLSSSDEEIKRMFFEGKAAFMLEGSWCAASIEASATHPEDYVITFVPGTDTRKTTDIIGGLSSGYYITRKAFEDEEKKAAAVSFVEYMTSDEMVSRFAQISATALINGVSIDTGDATEFIKSALNMAEEATGMSEAVQDYVPTECRAPIFENMKSILKGDKNIEDAVSEVITMTNRSGG